MEELKDVDISIVIGGKEQYDKEAPFLVEVLTDEITIETKLKNNRKLLIKFTKKEQDK
jgi:hypothetical protein